MLVLTRKLAEKIVINGNIVVTVLQIDGDRVKLGMEAPGDVTILRQELCEEVRRENFRAAAQSPANIGKLLDLLRREDRLGTAVK